MGQKQPAKNDVEHSPLISTIYSMIAVKPALPAAHDDAECIRERLPRHLPELLEAMGLSNV